MIFLKGPAAIRKAVRGLRRGKRLDVAVAFVGADWREILSRYRGRLRVICWLSSTNTNPCAVDILRKRRRTTVKQRDRMHCKVYLARGIGAVVGSANLSKAALAENDSAGQDEAAIFVAEPSILTEIEAWFDAMWNEKRTKTVRQDDIDKAIDAYERAQAARRQAGLDSGTGRGRQAVVPPLPKKLPATVRKYANKVRRLDLRQDLDPHAREVGLIVPHRLTAAKRERLIDLIVKWTRHPGVYKRFRRAPIARVRRGLGLLFDESIELQARLEEILSKRYLAGLRMSTLTLLLYWRYPDKYPPFNQRTRQFLNDFRMQARGLSGSSPRCYMAWLRWAERFRQQLGLPTAGYVDRLIDRYCQEKYAMG